MDYIAPGPVLTVHDAAASLPVPTGPSDGAALTLLEVGVVNQAGATVRGLPQTVVWYLDTTGTVTAPTLYAFFDGTWYPVGTLKALGADIAGDDSGRIEMGAGWERVAIAGAVTQPVTFRLPREERGQL